MGLYRDVPISELPEATTLDDFQALGNQGGVTKRLKTDLLKDVYEAAQELDEADVPALVSSLQTIEENVEADRAQVANNTATVTASATQVALDRQNVATNKAAVDAALASVAGGPVISINGKTGVVFTDPLSVADVQPTLIWDLTDPNGAPYKGNQTRATNGGMRMNSKGILVPTAVNEPVIDYGADGKPKGTGFFGAYTNLLLWSEALDNVAWVKSNTTISANAIVGPDGLMTFDKIVEDTSTAIHHAFQIVSLPNGSTFTASVTLKAGERSFARIRLGDSGFVGDAIVDFSAGVILSGTAVSSIRDIGNGFYRVSATGVVAAGNIASLQVTLRQSGGTENYLGDGSSGLYAGQCSITTTAFPVPYVPTTSAAVVRNADSMVIGGSDFADFFNPVEGTIFVDGDLPYSASFPRVIQIDDGTNSNRIVAYSDTTNNSLGCNVYAGGVAQSALFTVMAKGAPFRAAMTYKANEFRASVNGNARSDLSGLVPAGLTRLIVPADGDNRIRRLIYWPRALSATDLQRITA